MAKGDGILAGEIALKVVSNGFIHSRFLSDYYVDSLGGEATQEPLAHATADQDLNFIQGMRQLGRAFMESLGFRQIQASLPGNGLAIGFVNLKFSAFARMACDSIGVLASDRYFHSQTLAVLKR